MVKLGNQPDITGLKNGETQGLPGKSGWCVPTIGSTDKTKMTSGPQDFVMLPTHLGLKTHNLSKRAKSRFTKVPRHPGEYLLRFGVKKYVFGVQIHSQKVFGCLGAID